MDQDPREYAKRLDFLRSTPEYREWIAGWRDKLDRCEEIARDYLHGQRFDDA